jgi:CHAT domain-containing protein/tetratricopeptide (TPR) repeat protein
MKRNVGTIKEAVIILTSLFVGCLPVCAQLNQDAQVAEAGRLNKAALKLYAEGKYSEGAIMSQREITLREKTLGATHSTVAVAMNNLAEMLRMQGKYSEAAAHYQKALKIQEGNIGPEHADTLTTINNLALLHMGQGNYEQAEPLFLRALAARRRQTASGKGRQLAYTLNNLGTLYESQAKYSSAEPLYQEALRIRQDQLGANHEETATSLNNLGSLYQKLGNYERAEPFYRRALEIREKLLGQGHTATAVSLNNLAGLLDLLHKDAEAEVLYRRALKIWETNVGPKHPDTMKCLNNLANIYSRRSDFAAAKPLHEKILRIREETLGAAHPDFAVSLQNLAFVHESQGDFNAAESLYRRALLLNENKLGAAHPETILNIDRLAGLRERMGIADAVNSFDQSRQRSFAYVSRVLPSLPESEQRLFLSRQYESPFYVALSCGFKHASEPELVEISAGWVRNGKGMSQDALVRRNLLERDTGNPELADIVNTLLEVRRKLAVLAMSTEVPDSGDIRQTRMAELSREEGRLEKVLSLKIGDSVQPPEWIDPPTFRRALPAKSVFIDIARFPVLDFETNQWKSIRYVAWITRQETDGPTLLVDLGPADEIDTTITTIRKRIQSDIQSDGKIRTDGEQEATARLNLEMTKLSELIWKPIAPHVGDSTTILLSPDGSLWLAPWSALPLSEEATSPPRFFLEKYTLRLLTSGRQLATNRTTALGTAAPVIFADPAFDSTAKEKRASISAILRSIPKEIQESPYPPTTKRMLPRVARLPNTAAEAALIEPSLQTITGHQPQRYIDRYALESVARGLHRPRLAVFATHGFFLPDPNVDGQSLSEARENHATESSASEGASRNNPLLRCGLLLAGCNDNGASVGNDDGVLTGMEIASIDFRGTELVVLSACETGIGDVRNGEGVAGLRQAFQLAGATSVVASLWQVPDLDSAAIVNDFFGQIAKGISADEAMRQAQLNRIQTRTARFGAAHPIYWAAWTVTQ